MHQLKVSVGSRVFALGRTSELVGLRLGTRLRAMHTESNNNTATAASNAAATRSKESSSSGSRSSAYDEPGSDEAHAWSAAQPGGDATIVLVDRTQLLGGDSGAATTSHALSEGSALDALLACLPRASNSSGEAGATGAELGNSSDVPVEAWAHDVAVEPPALSPSIHPALWPGPLAEASSSSASPPAGLNSLVGDSDSIAEDGSGSDRQNSPKAWLDDMIGRGKLPPASLCHPTNQSTTALLHALAAPAPPLSLRGAQRGNDEEGNGARDQEVSTVLEASGARAVMAALQTALARAKSEATPPSVGAIDARNTGEVGEMVAHLKALLLSSPQTSENDGSNGDDDEEGILAVAVALVEAMARSKDERSVAALSSRLSELGQRLAGNSGSGGGGRQQSGAGSTLSAPDTDVLLLDLEAGLSRAIADTTSSAGVSLHDALLLLQQLSSLGPWTATETSFDGGYSEGYVTLRRRLHSMLRARLDAIARQPSNPVASGSRTALAGEAGAAAAAAAKEFWQWCGPWAPWAACVALASSGKSSSGSSQRSIANDNNERGAGYEEDDEEMDKEEMAASAAAAALELEDALDDILMRLSDLSQSCASLNSGSGSGDSEGGGGKDGGLGFGSSSSSRKLKSLPDFVGRLLAGPGSADAIGTSGLPIFQVGDGNLRPLPKPAPSNNSAGGQGQVADTKANASKSGGGGGLFGSFNKGLALLQQAAAVAASLVPTGGEADADPAGSPTLVVFVVGGLGPSEAASVGAAVQAAWAMKAANEAMASEAAAHNISTPADSASEGSGNEGSGQSNVIPRVLLGGSCLSSPSVLFSHICS